MIFVAVGAYDLPFNRLIKKIDELVGASIIKEEVFVQIGHAIPPKNSLRWERFLSYNKMNEYADKATILVTQGGPGCIMLALARGKIPIVVPRQKRFGEMVDDHQVLFTKRLEKEGKVVAVYDIDDLQEAVLNYHEKTKGLRISPWVTKEKIKNFADKLEKLILDL